MWRPDLTLLDGLTLPALGLATDGTLRYANAAALDLFGSPYDALVGHDARTRLLDEPARGALDQVLRLVERTGAWTGELPLLVGGTSARLVPTSWSRLGDAHEPAGAVLLVEPDAAGWAGAGQPVSGRLRLLAEVTAELKEAEDLAAVAAVVADVLRTAAGATVAALSLVEDDRLRLLVLRGGLEDVDDEWRSLPLSADLPGTECVRTGAPVLVTREEAATRYPDLPLLDGTGSVLCLPLLAGDERVLGAVSLSFPVGRELGEAEHAFLALLVDACAMTVDRVSAQAAAADREAQLAFLAQAGVDLARDLDYETTLAAVVQSAVPWFADWCTVAVLQDGTLRTIAIAHARPDGDPLLRRLTEDYPPRYGDLSYAALESGESVLVPEVTDDLLAQGAQDAEHLELLRGLQLRSGLVCPLTVGERTFGVITWVTGEGGRRFTEQDRDFGTALAHRAAVAMDNAQLHSQVRLAARELQRAVLPDELPEVPGWSTCVRHLPAGRGDTGGDFYDVLPLGDGRLACFVGDVMGRGVAAASVMAQMRSAIRTLVAVDPEPGAVMDGLDRVFDALHVEEQLVTVVYAVADPALNQLEVINAGHPPPLLLAASGEREVLDHPSTLILGVGGGRRTVRTAELRPGDRLLLFTDGLVERRGEDADAGLGRLVAAVHAPPGDDPEQWLSEVVEEVRDPVRDDDVLALLVSRDPAGA